MSPFPQVSEAERYFAAVSIKERDIALLEYQAAAERCREDERAITIANGLIIAGLAAMHPLLSPVLATLVRLDADSANLPLLAFTAGWAFITSVVTSYVCDLRRAYVFSARKVIVIRRLLGLSFGKFALVLPPWRLEGADQPFAIRLFPGWNPIAAYSLYATVLLSGSVLWLALLTALPSTSFSGQNPWITATVVSVAWSIYWLFSMRIKLFDTHESLALSAARLAAWLLNVRLVPDVHQSLYRAQLAKSEADRLKLDFEVIKPILIYREDRNFQHHRGLALRSMVRAGWDWLRRSPSGGASTITQQLARTLFVVDLQKTLRRKLVEMLLALWLDALWSKSEIVEVYISSVRYDNGVSGYLAARRHFRVNRAKKVSKGEAFVLVERVANIKGQFRASSVTRSLQGAISSGVMTKADATRALDLYTSLIRSNLIQSDPSASPEDIKAMLAI